MLLIFLLCIACTSYTMDDQSRVSMTFMDNIVVEQPRKIVCMFPLLDNLIKSFLDSGDIDKFLDNTIGLNQSLPVSQVPYTIFRLWASCAEFIKIQKNNRYIFPPDLPIPLIYKIDNFVTHNITIHNCSQFLNAGDFLEVPDNVMSLICKLIFKKLIDGDVSDDDYSKNITVIDIVTQKYCSDLLDPIKNMLFTHNGLFQLQETGRIKLKEEQSIPIRTFTFSKKHNYCLYVNKKGDNNFGNTLYKINFKTKKIEEIALGHTYQENIKSRTLLLCHAGQSPCFFTIVPHDDNLILRCMNNSVKDKKIHLDFSKEARVSDAAINADGKYLIVGYSDSSTTFSNYVIYDESGTQVNSVSMLPGRAWFICSPTDPSSVVFALSDKQDQQFQQLLPTIENNSIKMAFADARPFLVGKNLGRLSYNGSGEYIYAFEKKDTQIDISRFSSLDISQEAQRLNIKTKSRGDHITHNSLNHQGDFMACILMERNEKSELGFKNTLFLVDYLRNKVTAIQENVSEIEFDGYILAYVENKDDRVNSFSHDIVLYDVLHGVEITRYSISKASPRLLGFTKQHELVVSTSYIGNSEGKVFFYSTLKKECWEQIDHYITTFKFLKTDANWFCNLLLLHKSIEQSKYDSTQEWFDTIAHIFSEEFKKILMQCGFSKPTPVGVQPINIAESFTQKRLKYQKELQKRLVEVDQKRQQQQQRIQKGERALEDNVNNDEYRTRFNEIQSRWQLQERLSPQAWWQWFKMKAASESRRAYASLMALFK